MNKYPLWKNLLILAIVVCGAIYALPNLYGEDPAVEISATHTATVDAQTLSRVEQDLARASMAYKSARMSAHGITIRFANTDVQLRARDLIQQDLGDNFTVALDLLPATPVWLRWLHAYPMYLGLDLRGGVHFLMQVDMASAIKKAEEGYVDDLRVAMREKDARYLSVERLDSGGIMVRFRDANERDKGQSAIAAKFPELTLTDQQQEGEYDILVKLGEQALREKRKFALDQNITSLRNRVNELGVAEPIIQQQGQDRIVVELPGVQDIAKAKEILGRTATLEIMMVDEEHDLGAALAGQVPPGDKIFYDRNQRPILLKNHVIYSGDNIVDASAGFDSQQSGAAVVNITLDSRGAAINERITGDNVGKRMAVVYIEIRHETKLDAMGKPVLDQNGKPVKQAVRIEQVITSPVIREQLGKRFEISGLASIDEARDLALLLRAGALAAPVEIIEERTVGPSLGAQNIRRGFHSTWIGFAAIAVFMIAYYLIFGVISVIALAINVVLLIALLSILQATLTLPGMAGIALTVGMAIDANVLINERIREEIRNGNTPQASINTGYDRAFGTILDSNVTALIAGLALFMFGSGSVRGFAFVLCLGILTSMFSAVMISRSLVNLLYGSKRKLERISIGNTRWK
ncbi:MAG: protein translocase subunit SecD [Acidiferrobacterales bacterium]